MKIGKAGEWSSHHTHVETFQTFAGAASFELTGAKAPFPSDAERFTSGFFFLLLTAQKMMHRTRQRTRSPMMMKRPTLEVVASTSSPSSDFAASSAWASTVVGWLC